MSEKILSKVKPGVVYGKDLQEIFRIAKENKFALPAVNVVGTDSINALKHGENGLEILNLREGGMGSKMIFDCLTSNAAEALGREKEQGLIRKGFNADLIAVDKNPVENIEMLSEADNVKLVMVKGKIVKKA